MVIPSGQSMVADYYPEERRGAAFGALYLTGALGAMLGRLCPSRSLLQGRVLIASLWVSKRAPAKRTMSTDVIRQGLMGFHRS